MLLKELSHVFWTFIMETCFCEPDSLSCSDSWQYMLLLNIMHFMRKNNFITSNRTNWFPPFYRASTRRMLSLFWCVLMHCYALPTISDFKTILQHVEEIKEKVSSTKPFWPNKFTGKLFWDGNSFLKRRRGMCCILFMLFLLWWSHTCQFKIVTTRKHRTRHMWKAAEIDFVVLTEANCCFGTLTPWIIV